MNFHSRVGNANLFLNKTAVRDGAVTFIGFKRHGDGRIFPKTSLLNEDLSNGPNFDRTIPLDSTSNPIPIKIL
jgi:hypothetical protein